MKKQRDPHETVKQYFPFYPAMWLTSRKLRVCSSAARGVLTDLMAMCWEAGGTIEEPLDILAAAIRETPRKLHSLLLELSDRERITLNEDGDTMRICVPHLVGIYEEAVQHIEAKRAAGIKGAEVKYSTPIADPSECHSTTKARARDTGPDLIEPDLTASDKNKSEQKAKAKKADANQGFESFWNAYPRKEGKEAARKAWPKAAAELPSILAALEWQRISDAWRDPQFIPHGSTYLNGRRWEDDPVAYKRMDFSPKRPTQAGAPQALEGNSTIDGIHKHVPGGEGW